MPSFFKITNWLSQRRICLPVNEYGEIQNNPMFIASSDVPVCQSGLLQLLQNTGKHEVDNELPNSKNIQRRFKMT